jgi:hypothetical protein
LHLTLNYLRDIIHYRLGNVDGGSPGHAYADAYVIIGAHTDIHVHSDAAELNKRKGQYEDYQRNNNEPVGEAVVKGPLVFVLRKLEESFHFIVNKAEEAVFQRLLQPCINDENRS